jgi:hypothetical protein
MWRLLLTLVFTVAASAQDRDAVALQSAIRRELLDGDLQAAIQQYEEIAKSANRAIAAQALLRMGRCYERLGQIQAAKVYERVLTQFADQKDAAQEARTRMASVAAALRESAAPVGWYNGDWQSGIPGLANWYLSDREFARVYDDFVVPAGGWTVIGVFSNDHMDFDSVTEASWEIRSGMSAGSEGNVLASGLNAAKSTPIPGPGTLLHNRIQVNGLAVQLAPGRYWLSVAPVGKGKCYVSATLGRNAVGEPRGNNGEAFFCRPWGVPCVSAETIGTGGQLGIGKDFSQGVLISNPAR